jgi:hypothetical protein
VLEQVAASGNCSSRSSTDSSRADCTVPEQQQPCVHQQGIHQASGSHVGAQPPVRLISSLQRRHDRLFRHSYYMLTCCSCWILLLRCMCLLLLRLLLLQAW